MRGLADGEKCLFSLMITVTRGFIDGRYWGNLLSMSDSNLPLELSAALRRVTDGTDGDSSCEGTMSSFLLVVSFPIGKPEFTTPPAR